MKRFRRWLFRGAVTVSLVLLVATVVLGILSYTPLYASLSRERGSDGWIRVEFYHGVLRVEMGTKLKPYSEAWNPWVKPQREWTIPWAIYYYHGPEQLDFTPAPEFSSMQKTWPEIRIVVIFFLPTALIWGIYPAIAGLRIRTRRRQQRLLRNNQCPVCGYDLRATPWRCPECGTIPEKFHRTST